MDNFNAHPCRTEKCTHIAGANDYCHICQPYVDRITELQSELETKQRLIDSCIDKIEATKEDDRYIYSYFRELLEDLKQPKEPKQRLIDRAVEWMKESYHPRDCNLNDDAPMYGNSCDCGMDELLEDLKQSKCDHEWVSANNKVVSGTEICTKCYQLRSENLKQSGGE